MAWGCEFAVVAFNHIWYITPCIKLYEINFKIFSKFYSVIVHACCDPCYESCGLMFNAFKK